MVLEHWRLDKTVLPATVKRRVATSVNQKCVNVLRASLC